MLAVVLVLACVLRVAVHGGVVFSPADEGRYLAMSGTVARGGIQAFPSLVAEHVANAALHPFPSPLRYGHVLLGAAACVLHGGASFAALAALSLVASVVTLFATAALAFEVGGVELASIAALFVGVSPLELTLSRRALQDAVVVAAATLALLAYVRVRAARPAGGARVAFVVAASTFLAVKETSLGPYLAFVALALVDALRTRDVRPLLLVGAPILLACAGFLALGGTLTDARALFRIAEASADYPYVRAYLAGPAHRVLLDLFALAPLATVAAIVGVRRAIVGSAGERPEVVRVLVAFVVVALVVAAGLPKTVRFTAIVEPALAVVAAIGLRELLDGIDGARRHAITWGAVAFAVVASSWAIFSRVFLERGVYDPTTYDVLAALDAVPHAGAMSAGTFAAPIVAVAALVFGASVASRAP
jgi:hypothetical protein